MLQLPISRLIASFLIAFAAAAYDPLQSAEVLASPVPDALTARSGRKVTGSEEWTSIRRAQILRDYAEYVYGHTPTETIDTRFHLDSIDPAALGGAAVRKQITISFAGRNDGPRIHLLLYLPARRRTPVPVIAGLNFEGNQAVDADPGIALADVWIADPADTQPVRELRRHIKVRAKEESRGHAGHRWEIEKVIQHGFGLATIYYGDIEPDFPGGLPIGVRSLFLRPGQTEFAANEWGAFGAWAWGLSRAVDYLQNDPAIDPHQIVAFGHSRLGKAAVWAAAQDERFAAVLSNESGMGGVSLFRAKEGETIKHLNTAFPHWFCRNFQAYTDHAERVPVDGNLLLSLIAPRPAYVASAEQDSGSNPRAEFMSAVLASPVYQLFGKQGLATNVMPALNQSVMGKDQLMGYHVRSGIHDVTDYDWDQYLRFLQMMFSR